MSYKGNKWHNWFNFWRVLLPGKCKDRKMAKEKWEALFAALSPETMSFLDYFRQGNAWVVVPEYDDYKTEIAQLCSTKLLKVGKEDYRLFQIHKSVGYKCRAEARINPCLFKDFVKNFEHWIKSNGLHSKST